MTLGKSSNSARTLWPVFEVGVGLRLEQETDHLARAGFKRQVSGRLPNRSWEMTSGSMMHSKFDGPIFHRTNVAIVLYTHMLPLAASATNEISALVQIGGSPISCR